MERLFAATFSLISSAGSSSSAEGSSARISFSSATIVVSDTISSADTGTAPTKVATVSIHARLLRIALLRI